MFAALFGAEWSIPVWFVVAFVILLLLMTGTFWLVRRFRGTQLGMARSGSRQQRLAVTDAAAVDGRRRLLLVRRDNVEHLLMIGGPSDKCAHQGRVNGPVRPQGPVSRSHRGVPETRGRHRAPLCPKASAPLQTRVGIATGLVVVGDLIESKDAVERGIVGETPNLADPVAWSVHGAQEAVRPV